MKITQKELLEWVKNQTPVRHKGEIYRTQYNGRYYFLKPIMGGEIIQFYDKGCGVFGLESNKN